MDVRHLRSFVTIVDAGGFGRAGGRLHVSQPALSRQIKALEAALDVRLFDRLGRRVQLTSAGEDLLRRARQLLSDVDSLGDRARALRSGQTGVLRVGATPQAVETLLAGFLVQHRRRHPAVDVHLVEDGGVRLVTRLERGDVHLSLTATADARFRSRPLLPLYLVAVVPTSQRVRGTTLDITQLADVPLLLPRRDFASRTWFDAEAEAARMRPHVLLESGAPSALVALARAGYATAIVPSNVPMPRAGVRVLPLVQRGAAIGRWLGIAWDPRRFQAPYAARFVDELAAYAQRPGARPSFLRRAPALPRPVPATSE